MDSCLLQHTFETWEEMVMNNRRVKRRCNVKPEVFMKESKANILEDAAHLLKRLPYNYEQLCLSEQGLCVLAKFVVML